MKEELYMDDQTVSILILNATERSMVYNSKKNSGGTGAGSDDDQGPESSMTITDRGNGRKRKQKDHHELC